MVQQWWDKNDGDISINHRWWWCNFGNDEQWWRDGNNDDVMATMMTWWQRHGNDGTGTGWLQQGHGDSYQWLMMKKWWCNGNDATAVTMMVRWCNCGIDSRAQQPRWQQQGAGHVVKEEPATHLNRGKMLTNNQPGGNHGDSIRICSLPSFEQWQAAAAVMAAGAVNGGAVVSAWRKIMMQRSD